MNDLYSLKILDALQKDARLSVQQVSDQVGLSPTPCWKRIRDMEAKGVITGYAAQLDRKQLGLSLLVLAEINLSQHTDKHVASFEAAVQASRQIVRCYSTSGASDYVLTIVARDMEDYGACQKFCVRGITCQQGA